MFGRVAPLALEKYGVDYRSIGEPQKGYRNESYPVMLADGTVLNLIFFKAELQILGRIKRADYVAHETAVHGLPVRLRHDPRLLRVKDGVYVGLYNYLPGQTVPWEALTKRHIKLMGNAMADIHTALEFTAPHDDAAVQDELLPLIDRMSDYFGRDDVRRAMAEKLTVQITTGVFEPLKSLVRRVSTLDGQQPLHMDMVRGNVLFDTPVCDDVWQIDDVALTGVIDFEKTAIGHPLFDIARTLAFLLVDSPKPSSKIHHYFLDSGYHKRGKRPLPDSRLLAPLIKLFLLHDFYKFLRHTPYESLAANHHYTRTCEILKTYGMISAKS